MELSNQSFRNYIKTVHDIAKTILGPRCRNEELLKSVIFRNLCQNDFFNFDYQQFGFNLSKNDKYEIVLTQGFTEAVMLIDLYIKLNKKICLGIASKKDEKLINRIIECFSKQEENKYQSLFIDPSAQTELVSASLEFIDSPAFEKVLGFKCLDEDDISILSSITPFFQEEKEKYGIEINKDFLIRQINRWKKVATEDESISAASDFLIDAFKMDIDVENLVVDIINHAENEDVMQALVDEDEAKLSVYLLAYYREYNQKGPKL